MALMVEGMPRIQITAMRINRPFHAEDRTVGDATAPTGLPALEIRPMAKAPAPIGAVG